MAGGIGSRFWPFSRNNRPKQFLDFFGTGRSLLQMTFDRFSRLMPVENILIVSNILYRDLILEQLPEIKPSQVLLEPNRRNTAPCIAYAVNRIKSMTDKANIVVAPSDHLIMKEIDFIDAIKTGLDFVEKNDSLLTLGIKPSRPETGYGYNQMPNWLKSFSKLVNFSGIRAFFYGTSKPSTMLSIVYYPKWH
jgi:mannose-1-phosphate guanylyltransferase